MITIDDFLKVELKVGTVIEASEVEGSDKLIKQIVDFGDEKRQILSGIKRWYTPDSLVGKQFVYCINLEPRMMMGFESQGMLLCADGKKPMPLKPIKKVPNGAKLR
jgi:methionine--tRNA ligase beta chain